MTIPEIQAEIATLQAQLAELIHQETMTPEQIKINGILSKYIGTRCTLDPSVPIDVQCAEAVSFLLNQIGIFDGIGGIAGTTALLEWVVAHPQFFQEIYAPEESALLISATNTCVESVMVDGVCPVEGHTGFFGSFGKVYENDWGIVSNNSATGLLGEQWSLSAWNQNYTVKGGIPPRMFRIII